MSFKFFIFDWDDAEVSLFSTDLFRNYLLMAEMQWQIKVVIRNFYSEILKGKLCLDQCGVGICFF